MLDIEVRKQRGTFTAQVAFSSATPGVTALFGRSGCGKTTTIHMIAGLLRPDRGHIRIDDTVLFDAAQGIDVPAEQRGIGYVFQDARLFPHLSVRDNLRYGARRARGRAQRIPFAEVVELLGLMPLLARRPAGLSGGERQRVAIGRALLAQPRLLLLDEPLAAIDVARRGELLPYLEKLRDQFSLPMVFVSHQFEEVLRLAGSVIVLEHGAVVGQGDVISMSQSSALRAIIGAESQGAVVEGITEHVDTASGLAQIRIGEGQLRVAAGDLTAGQRVRIQLLARDLILAVAPPSGLSVRNSLPGILTRLEPDGARAWLVFADIGGATLMVRVTDDARQALALALGQPVWVLVKTVSLQGHVFSGPR
ncbi:MAG TPA: molybdenum ABC transporter ATP-binding protein [Steroidobacteraceae bacterium]|jgi:molybdate transport system ATP-binding protein|nr:molybdenum ABC transporter ATP-binding protein [Steroidobacteraceae bacterium]